VARSNFGFQKYQKELKRKKKSEEKRQRSLNKKNPGSDAPPSDSTTDTQTDSGPANPPPAE
jgi:hypothetical protein